MQSMAFPKNHATTDSISEHLFSGGGDPGLRSFARFGFEVFRSGYLRFAPVLATPARLPANLH